MFSCVVVDSVIILKSLNRNKMVLWMTTDMSVWIPVPSIFYHKEIDFLPHPQMLPSCLRYRMSSSLKIITYPSFLFYPHTFSSKHPSFSPPFLRLIYLKLMYPQEIIVTRSQVPWKPAILTLHNNRKEEDLCPAKNYQKVRLHWLQ